MVKKRIIKKFEQLSPELLKLVKLAYPDGFEDYLISFETPKGEIHLALPFETDEISYLIKMPKNVDFDNDDNDGPGIDENDFSSFDKLEVASGSDD